MKLNVNALKNLTPAADLSRENAKACVKVNVYNGGDPLFYTSAGVPEVVKSQVDALIDKLKDLGFHGLETSTDIWQNNQTVQLKSYGIEDIRGNIFFL